jgi:hypothetical protein
LRGGIKGGGKLSLPLFTFVVRVHGLRPSSP